MERALIQKSTDLHVTRYPSQASAIRAALADNPNITTDGFIQWAKDNNVAVRSRRAVLPSMIAQERKRGVLGQTTLRSAVRPDDPWYTYAILCRDYIKFGQTQDVQDRIKNLQTANPYELVLLGTSTVPEQEVHARLHSHRIRGEWFRICSDTIDFFTIYFVAHSESKDLVSLLQAQYGTPTDMLNFRELVYQHGGIHKLTSEVALIEQIISQFGSLSRFKKVVAALQDVQVTETPDFLEKSLVVEGGVP